jgi:single-strand DNA-binding protein
MTSGGQAVLKLRLATSETYLDKNRARQERTEWHSVVVWGKRAEALNKILAKGSRLFIEGALRTSSYDDRDGNKRYRTEIVANNVILAGRSGGAGGGREYETTQGRDAYDAPGGGYEPGGFDDAGPGPGASPGANTSLPDDDDIPF